MGEQPLASPPDGRTGLPDASWCLATAAEGNAEGTLLNSERASGEVWQATGRALLQERTGDRPRSHPTRASFGFISIVL